MRGMKELKKFAEAIVVGVVVVPLFLLLIGGFFAGLGLLLRFIIKPL